MTTLHFILLCKIWKINKMFGSYFGQIFDIFSNFLLNQSHLNFYSNFNFYIQQFLKFISSQLLEWLKFFWLEHYQHLYKYFLSSFFPIKKFQQFNPENTKQIIFNIRAQMCLFIYQSMNNFIARLLSLARV
jgi:hypothetical protein